MTIVNGYATLAEFKDRFFQQRTYTAKTISFTLATLTIADTANGFARFPTGSAGRVTRLLISGAAQAGNNGYFSIDYNTTVTPAAIVVTSAIVNEVVGATVTITDVTDTVDDTAAEIAIEAASRMIDDYTKRQFFQSGAGVGAPETRYFTPECPDRIYIDDLVSVTTLATDDGGGTYPTVWVAGDYVLLPENASIYGNPYTYIEEAAGGANTFGSSRKGVQISGVWGFPAVPMVVRQACIIQALRLFKRKDSPFGVAGVGEFGQVQLQATIDPDVKQLLSPFVRNYI
jgi:hypothetical protein